MVVVWGNILSLIGNAFAQAVEILVFDAFFTRNENTKNSLALYFIMVGHFHIFSYRDWYEIRLYVQDASGNCVPVHILCFPIPSRWDRRFFIVVSIYAVLFSYSHWFESFCLYAGIWTTKNIYGMFLYTPCYSSFAGLFPYLLH